MHDYISKYIIIYLNVFFSVFMITSKWFFNYVFNLHLCEVFSFIWTVQTYFSMLTKDINGSVYTVYENTAKAVGKSLWVLGHIRNVLLFLSVVEVFLFPLNHFSILYIISQWWIWKKLCLQKSVTVSNCWLMSRDLDTVIRSLHFNVTSINNVLSGFFWYKSSFIKR